MIKQIISEPNFTIETPSLHIRPIRKEDASHYLRELDLEVTRYQSIKPFLSIDQVKEFVEKVETDKKQGKLLVFSIYTKPGEFIGSISFEQLDQPIPCSFIWICKNKWHQGYGYEALKGMIRFMIHYLKLEGVMYEVDTRNIPAIGLMEKLQGKKVDQYEQIREDGNSVQLIKYLIS